MDNTMMATILWVGAGAILLLYLARRSRRKRSR